MVEIRLRNRLNVQSGMTKVKANSLLKCNSYVTEVMVSVIKGLKRLPLGSSALADGCSLRR